MYQIWVPCTMKWKKSYTVVSTQEMRSAPVEKSQAQVPAVQALSSELVVLEVPAGIGLSNDRG